MINTIRQRMSDYAVSEMPVDLPQAAVLMPFTNSREPELVLTVRSADMPTHAGEVAFPGGKRDRTDDDLLATALRESNEEVGLLPSQVDVVGQLTPIVSRFGMVVTPFIGVIEPGVEMVPEPAEIDEIFQVPWRFFLEEDPMLSAPINVNGTRLRIPTYLYEGKKIWGLTAFMIVDVLNFFFDRGIRIDVGDS